jgi:hypothetical protein
MTAIVCGPVRVKNRPFPGSLSVMTHSSMVYGSPYLDHSWCPGHEAEAYRAVVAT